MGDMPVYSLLEAQEAMESLEVAVQDAIAAALNIYAADYVGRLCEINDDVDSTRFAFLLVAQLVADPNVVFYPTPYSMHEALGAVSKKVVLREG